MPIVFHVVSADAYQAWLVDAKKKFASVSPDHPVSFASNDVNSAAAER
jgi:hypothetical protein